MVTSALSLLGNISLLIHFGLPPEQEQLKMHCTTGSAARNESPDSHVKLIQVHVHISAIWPQLIWPGQS